MLIGTANLEQLAAEAAEVPRFAAHDIVCEDVVCLQLTAEMPNTAREAVLPPSLHPTVPAALSIQAFAVGNSPWGSFNFATTRVSCRSGVRARGFTTRTIVDNAQACTGLSSQLGFPAVTGDISFRHGYDGASVKVAHDGRDILHIEAIDPEPMGLDDVQYTGTLNLAQTPKGLRLMQVEAHTQASRVDRVQARLEDFDGAGWGNPLLDPVYVIAASITRISLVYPPVRFVCKADELAFTGTEAVE